MHAAMQTELEWKSEVEVGNGSRKWMTLPSHRHNFLSRAAAPHALIILTHATIKSRAGDRALF